LIQLDPIDMLQSDTISYISICLEFISQSSRITYHKTSSKFQ